MQSRCIAVKFKLLCKRLIYSSKELRGVSCILWDYGVFFEQLAYNWLAVFAEIGVRWLWWLLKRFVRLLLSLLLSDHTGRFQKSALSSLSHTGFGSSSLTPLFLISMSHCTWCSRSFRPLCLTFFFFCQRYIWLLRTVFCAVVPTVNPNNESLEVYSYPVLWLLEESAA